MTLASGAIFLHGIHDTVSFRCLTLPEFLFSHYLASADDTEPPNRAKN